MAFCAYDDAVHDVTVHRHFMKPLHYRLLSLRCVGPWTYKKVSIWTDRAIVESDEISMLALALFIVATAGLESMMMVSGRKAPQI